MLRLFLLCNYNTEGNRRGFLLCMVEPWVSLSGFIPGQAAKGDSDQVPVVFLRLKYRHFFAIKVTNRMTVANVSIKKLTNFISQEIRPDLIRAP